MCVRTKTSYGCGHEFKTTNQCDSPSCQHLERYLYEKGGDCRACKEGGDAITRGREGKGRYAQEISRRHQREAWSESPTDDNFHRTSDVGGGISPWATPLKREKEWHSPSRKKADDAWLQEHVERSIDLQTIRESLSSCASSDRASTAVYSPQCREGRVYEYEDDCHRDHDYEYDRHRRRGTADRSLQIEIRSIHDDYDRRSHRRPTHHRRRHDSQESFESMPSTRSSTRKYKPAPTTYTAHEYYEPHDSGYGSYGSRASNGYGGAKTEPYTYSPLPRTVNIKPPSATSYGVYQTGFGVGGVDIVSRVPMYSYPPRRH
ncbi:uncharacterized protein Z518_06297 [Rhinocladiella mackenziei CBS 650.93]|uniref:Uncharacterized protein n=1 Tax=Rhinocladiella mackenziei CBS 650.93 TaxID=1442369 RepID=A0A0D2J8J8_9EURO|nr:uncharacterized protein Z518_06297 [Rhinocladiella mackenziei CBS 650.93]KIX05425.1 hypothetical protein Z518_06297 [Rhinocladiella mackenziei CBS 650.93]